MRFLLLYCKFDNLQCAQNFLSILCIFVIIILIFGCTNQQQIDKKLDNLTKPKPQMEAPPSSSRSPSGSPSSLTDSNKNEADEVINNSQIINQTPNKVYYFYNPNCFACRDIKPKIDELEAKYNDSILFIRYSIFDSKGLGQYNKFALMYNLSNKSRVVPLIYFNDKILAGKFEINDSLELFIKNEFEK